MTTEAGRTEDLFAQAAQGRGFWAGLFPAAFELGGVQYPVGGDKHVTLAHFGRGVTAQTVERAVTACRRGVELQRGAIVAKSWATARMDQKAGSVVALLLESAELADLYRTLLVNCRELNVRVDDRFGFHPHVTIGRLGRGDPAVIEAIDRVELRFAGLSLVCGDARVDFDFGKAPF